MKVTIITVSFNSCKTILDTVKSVNNQSYENIQHILIDGGSIDNTVELFVMSTQRESFVISEKDKGIYNAMNKGLKYAKGQIIGFLNSDDFFKNSKVVEKIVSSFTNEVDMVHGDLEFINGNGLIVRRWNSRGFKPDDFSKSKSPAHPTLYCRSYVFESLVGFNESYKVAGDIDFMIRAILLKKFAIRHINEVLITMRVGGVSTSSIKSLFIISKEVKKSFRDNCIDFNLTRYIIFKVIKIINQIFLSMYSYNK